MPQLMMQIIVQLVLLAENASGDVGSTGVVAINDTGIASSTARNYVPLTASNNSISTGTASGRDASVGYFGSIGADRKTGARITFYGSADLTYTYFNDPGNDACCNAAFLVSLFKFR